jgi:hypothetical protein
MAKVKIEPCLEAFEGSVVDSLQFVRDAQGFLEPGRQDPVILHIRRREEFAGLGLLKIQIAWEIFLEEAFTRYMCGAESPSGFRPALNGTRKKNIEAARADLLGTGRSYLNWSSANTTRRAMGHFQNGEPFVTSLSAVNNLLEEMAGIRNRFAHSSQHAARVFAAIVRVRLGFVPRGMTVGRFLLTPISGLQGSGPRYIDLYGNSLLGAARAIAPR